MMKKCLSAFLLVAWFGLPALAQNWVVLGSREVRYRAEKDTIKVTAKGTFRKIKLRVRGNGVRFYDLRVHFENGDVQDVPLRVHIERGGETRVIDLPGKRRNLKKVVFRYETQGQANRKATVVLMGRR